MTAQHKDPFIVFGAPEICESEIDDVVDSMRSCWLGTGPKVAKFERAFADYKGVAATNVAALNSCTAALHVSMIAAAIEPGDEVITTALTFCATVNAIIHSGAVPVLADVDPLTMNIDPASVRARITPRTRAIVPVHFAGRPCEMDELMEIAEQKNLLVIEDCAHAIETQYHGRNAGTFGGFGCFSFYATKNVTTGEGGMVVAKDEKCVERIKVLSLHGMSKDAWHRFGDEGYKHYFVTDAGFKYNMMDLQAAIGIHQLARVERNLVRRQEIWRQYQEAFADLPVRRPLDPAEGTQHAHHLYTLLIDPSVSGVTRDDFLVSMTNRGVGIGVHYLSIPEHPYYKEKFGWQPEDCPNAMNIGRSTVSLPLSAKLSDGDVARVIESVRRTVLQY